MKNTKAMDGMPKASQMKMAAAKKAAGKVMPTGKGATAKVMAMAKKGGKAAKKKGY
ncbi:MAG: hypothetical protein ACO3JH_02615 [Flavobacteriaceae bacterium]